MSATDTVPGFQASGIPGTLTPEGNITGDFSTMAEAADGRRAHCGS